jgi:hypothetical protein
MDNIYGSWNAQRFKTINVIPHLLAILNESPAIEIVEIVVRAIDALLRHKMTEEDLDNISEFIMSSLEPDASNAFSPPSAKTPNNRNVSFSSLKKKKPNTLTKIAARNLVLKLLYDLITKLGSDYLDVFAKGVTIRWFYQFVNQRVQPISIILAMQLLSVVIISDKFKNDKIYGVLKHGLVSYCNQQDLYYTLLSLMMGKMVNYGHDIQYDDRGVPIFEHLLPIGYRDGFGSITGATDRGDIEVPFIQVLPIILELVKANADQELGTFYNNASAFKYFSNFVTEEKSQQAKKRWQLVKNYVMGGYTKEAPEEVKDMRTAR